MSKFYKYRCKFCGAGFKTEDRFMKHHCKAMERDEQIRTPTGIAALEYYRLWMTAQKRMMPSAEQFLNSKLYTTFFEFAKFAQKTGIPNTEQYIKYMIRKDVSPTIWRNDMIYGEYLQYLDRGADPDTQIQGTVEALLDLADHFDCDVAEVFEHLNSAQVIHMLKQRQLSPWILLRSKKFRDFCVEKASSEQRIVIQSIIKPKIWVQRFKDHPKVLEKIKEIVSALDL